MTAACIPCEHSDRTGSWVDAAGFDGMTHCRGCHRSWPRRTEWQHCTVCHETFSTIAAADMHRDNGRCLPPGEVTTRTGRPKLAVATRKMDPRTTVTLWVRADDRDRSHHRVEIESEDDR